MQEENSQSSWQFVKDVGSTEATSSTGTGALNQEFTWSASEFIAYHKSFGWYLAVFLFLLVLAGGMFFITGRDIVSTISIMVVGTLFMVYASRKPRVLKYTISKNGVQIGDKLYSFSILRSFAIIDEGSLRSISLLPLKRFMPTISMYFEPQDEPKIIEALGSYLPKEDKRQDIVDKFMHKIRF